MKCCALKQEKLPDQITLGEKVVWHGRPDLKLIHKKEKTLIRLAMTVVFYIVLSAFAARGSLLFFSQADIFYLTLILALSLFLLPWMSVEKTLYVVTGKRALLINLNDRALVREYAAADLKHLDIVRGTRGGSIYLENGTGKGGKPIKLGFTEILDVDGAEKALKAITDKA